MGLLANFFGNFFADAAIQIASNSMIAALIVFAIDICICGAFRMHILASKAYQERQDRRGIIAYHSVLLGRGSYF